MSDIELGQLRGENERLKKDLEQARKESAKYRTDRAGKVKGAEDSLAEAMKELENLRKENIKLSKKLDEMPGEVQAENDRLKGEIRQRDHRSAFDKLAKEAKADPKAIDALWKLSEYAPDAEAVDEARIRETISKTLEANPFLRAAQDARPVHLPGPAGGQGPKANNPAGSFTMSYEQGRDYNFQRENRSQIQEAARRGLLTVLPPNE